MSCSSHAGYNGITKRGYMPSEARSKSPSIAPRNSYPVSVTRYSKAVKSHSLAESQPVHQSFAANPSEHHRLEGTHLTSVLNNLSMKTNVVSLSLEGNLLTPSAILSLCDTIRMSTSRFTSINLSMCGLGDGPASEIIRAVTTQKSEEGFGVLGFLDMSCNHISEKGAIMIAEVFNQQQMWKLGDKTHKRSGSCERAKSISNQKTQNQGDDGVNMRRELFNRIFSDGMMPTISHAIDTREIGKDELKKLIPTSLHTLVLRFNPIGCRGLMALLENESVLELDVRYCNLMHEVENEEKAKIVEVDSADKICDENNKSQSRCTSEKDNDTKGPISDNQASQLPKTPALTYNIDNKSHYTTAFQRSLGPIAFDNLLSLLQGVAASRTVVRLRLDGNGLEHRDEWITEMKETMVISRSSSLTIESISYGAFIGHLDAVSTYIDRLAGMGYCCRGNNKMCPSKGFSECVKDFYPADVVKEVMVLSGPSLLVRGYIRDVSIENGTRKKGQCRSLESSRNRLEETDANQNVKSLQEIHEKTGRKRSLSNSKTILNRVECVEVNSSPAQRDERSVTHTNELQKNDKMMDTPRATLQYKVMNSERAMKNTNNPNNPKNTLNPPVLERIRSMRNAEEALKSSRRKEQWKESIHSGSLFKMSCSVSNPVSRNNQHINPTVKTMKWFDEVDDVTSNNAKNESYTSRDSLGNSVNNNSLSSDRVEQPKCSSNKFKDVVSSGLIQNVSSSSFNYPCSILKGEGSQAPPEPGFVPPPAQYEVCHVYDNQGRCFLGGDDLSTIYGTKAWDNDGKLDRCTNDGSVTTFRRSQTNDYIWNRPVGYPTSKKQLAYATHLLNFAAADDDQCFMVLNLRPFSAMNHPRSLSRNRSPARRLGMVTSNSKKIPSPPSGRNHSTVSPSRRNDWSDPANTVAYKEQLRSPDGGLQGMPEKLLKYTALPSELGDGDTRIYGLAKLLCLILYLPGKRLDIPATLALSNIPFSIKSAPLEVMGKYRAMRERENREVNQIVSSIFNSKRKSIVSLVPLLSPRKA